jgi:hypothetical protein
MDHYILDENDCPRLVDMEDYYKWQRALPDGIKTRMGFKLARDEVEGVYVSTVYLGLDHAYECGPPILWETMVFGLANSETDCERSANRKDALKVHQKFCRKYLRIDCKET